MNQDLTAYYNDRAKEYDKVYLNPDEQPDLAAATSLFQELFAQKTVLEIACGTGYWTQRIAQVAQSILATDINESVIDIARSGKNPDNVRFQKADMYTWNTAVRYDALFGGFIWSHIPLQDLDDFLQHTAGFVRPNGTMVFIDSKPVKNSKHDIRNISHTDEHGNTFQARALENGSKYLVMKNFPTPEFLTQKLSNISTDIRHVDLEHYWIVCSKVKAGT